jgi:oligopeptide transport system ATP-binding protein
MGQERILEVNDLHVSFDTYSGEVHAVRGVSFYLNKAEVIAIVGESGCGKSVTAKSIMKLIPMPPGRIKKGNIVFDGKDITNYTKKQMQTIRGSEIGMIFQDPMTSLSPTMLVGNQIAEGLIQHQRLTKKQAHERAVDMLKMVGIPNPDKRAKQYPHEFSGGMRQRVMIAIALACNPKVLIADEPTTALDVTIQAQILDLMKELKKQIDTSIILITHDLGVVAGMAERLMVMYAGKVVETGYLQELFDNPKHPYTWGLLKSIPRLDSENKEDLIPIKGTPTDMYAPPKGCGFAARCNYSMKICYLLQPDMKECGQGHQAACWLLHQYSQDVVRPEGIGRNF